MESMSEIITIYNFITFIYVIFIFKIKKLEVFQGS
jgi:hypothetical protein